MSIVSQDQLQSSSDVLRVTFVLPKFVDHPVGGYKVVVDYANALARRGHKCTIVLPLFGCWNDLAPRPPFGSLLPAASEAVRARGGIPWATLEPTVQIKQVVLGTARSMPVGDVIIATAWVTAATVHAAPPTCGQKLYFIQHYETAWAEHDPDVVRRTWQLPMQKGVIAKWLVELGAEFGEAERINYVPNGIDLSFYRVVKPIDTRSPLKIGMLVHSSSWKGTDIGLRALDLVRHRVAGLEVVLYGAAGGDEGLPPWVSFAGRLVGQQVVDYFNELAIFIHPSLTEGWPLPPAEAMACGAAVVCADNEGVLDYAVDGANAAVVPRGSAEALADAIIGLIEEPKLRIALAQHACQDIQAYGVEIATDRFEELVRRVATRSG